MISCLIDVVTLCLLLLPVLLYFTKIQHVSPDRLLAYCMIISFTGIDNIIMLYSYHPVILYYTCMFLLLRLYPVYSTGIISLLLPVNW